MTDRQRLVEALASRHGDDAFRDAFREIGPPTVANSRLEALMGSTNGAKRRAQEMLRIASPGAIAAEQADYEAATQSRMRDEFSRRGLDVAGAADARHAVLREAMAPDSRAMHAFRGLAAAIEATLRARAAVRAACYTPAEPPEEGMSNEKCDGMKECAKDQAIRAAQEAAFREHQWAHKTRPIGASQSSSQGPFPEAALAGASLRSDGTLGYTIGQQTAGMSPVVLGQQGGPRAVAYEHLRNTRIFTREEVLTVLRAALATHGTNPAYEIRHLITVFERME